MTLEDASRIVVVLAAIVLVVLRAPHGARSREVPVARSFRGRTEKALLAFAAISFLVPLVWAASPSLFPSPWPQDPVRLTAGAVLLAAGLLLFHRSHADLGSSWSISLELRERHVLVTGGVYRHVRHPMYAALLLYGAGQSLALPDRIAGPSYLVASLLLAAFRIGPEERMMRERFGAEYDAYCATTRRLVPGVY